MRIAISILTVCLAGCSVLSGTGRDDPIRCEQPDPLVNPCEGVFADDDGACVDNFCQRVTNMPESCDGADNDFDGRIDEGLDVDGDGFTWCESGAAGPVDCLDSNPNIHPPDLDDFPDEECDGADNDCDGSIDEMPRTRPLCDPMMRCYPDRGGCDFIDCRDSAVGCPERHRCDTDRLPAECIVVIEDCSVDGCTAPQRCDPLSLMCTDPLPIGAPCADDVLCASTHCYSVGALELASGDVGGATRICSAPCCSDNDCASDQVCWTPGTGARGCVPRAIIAAGPEGDLMSSPCTSHGTCPGELCKFGTTSAYRDNELVLTACGAPAPMTRPPGSTCSDFRECDTSLCLRTFIGNFCSEPCGQAEDCPSVFDTCAYGAWMTASDTDYIQVCTVSSPFGTNRDDREGCSDNLDCREGACIDSVCSKVCCADSQCGADRTCGPVSINGRWEMHCVPLPVP